MEAVSEDGLKVARFDPDPTPWRSFSRVAAVVSSLGSIYNPNPDDPNEPHGPGGPVIRDLATAVAVYQIGSLITDASVRAGIQAAATKAITAAAGQLAPR